jgi:hypothetical protein
MVMRSLEMHHIETERDLTLALTCDLVLPEQVAATQCIECKERVCYSNGNEFIPFVLVLDENDQDWIVCEDCASPILDSVDSFFPPVVKSHFAVDEDFEPF